MSPLIVSTLPHYLAVVPFFKGCKLPYIIRSYISTIILSSTLSIIWYLNPSSTQIMVADYSAAGIWGVLDIILAQQTDNFTVISRIVILDGGVFCLNIFINIFLIKYYVLFHSLWHCLSAIKCIYVSHLFANYI